MERGGPNSITNGKIGQKVLFIRFSADVGIKSESEGGRRTDVEKRPI